jgi:hypothetical protein
LSKIEVNTIEPQCGTTLTVGAVGTTVTVPSNVVKSNALQAADGGNIVSQSGTTITLGATGDSINLASGASQSGFGRSGSVNWITTPKTATFTAADGEGYFCDTTISSFTVNLPAGVAGAIVSINDYARTFATNSIVVSPNGTDKISTVNASLVLIVNGQTATFVYVDSTQGWINTMDSDAGLVPSLFFAASGGVESTCGDFKTHIFTGPGSFSVTGVAPAPSGNPNALEYLVVAGGGGGNGSRDGTSPNFEGGGGGAGGMRFNYPGSCFTGSAGIFSIAVGAGGSNSPGGQSGSPSTFSTITSAGGGGGSGSPSRNGGSGGGSSSSPASGGTAGLGNTPPVSPSQGNPGGVPPARYGGGGGGGAAAAGCSTTGGNGSPVAIAFIGAVSSCYGTSGPAPGRYFSGGGGGALIQPGASGTGGAGGGGPGNGSCSPANDPSPATAGTTNTGGGGGAANRYTGVRVGGSGGSGIVMIRYKFQ